MNGSNVPLSVANLRLEFHSSCPFSHIQLGEVANASPWLLPSRNKRNMVNIKICMVLPRVSLSNIFCQKPHNICLHNGCFQRFKRDCEIRSMPIVLQNTKSAGYTAVWTYYLQEMRTTIDRAIGIFPWDARPQKGI